MSRGRLLLAIAALVALAVVGTTSWWAGRGEAPSPQSETWIESIPEGAAVRDRADVALFARDVGELGPFGAVATRWISSAGGSMARSVVEGLSGTARGAGPVDAGRPVAVFQGDRWGLMVPTTDWSEARESLRRWADGRGAAVERLGEGLRVEFTGGELEGLAGRWRIEPLGRGYVAAVEEPAERESSRAPIPGRSLVGDALGERDEERHRIDRVRLLSDLASREEGVVGLFDGAGSSLAGLPGDWAGTPLERLQRQLGPVAFHVGADRSSARTALPTAIDATLRLSEASGVPKVVDGLGRPETALPDGLDRVVGGDEIGIARLSVDAESLHRLVRSALPAAVRRRLTAYWRRLADELSVDRPEELIAEWSGHAIVVVSGFERPSGEGEGRSLDDYVTLDATTETVILPLRRHQPVERFLDAATQLSRGRLRRSDHEARAEYAWLEDGELEWTLMLGDQFLVYADSARGLDRGRRLFASSGSQGRERTEGLLDELGRGAGRSGLYLNARRLERVMGENDSALSRMLESALFVTGVEGETSRLRIRLRMRGEPAPP